MKLEIRVNEIDESASKKLNLIDNMSKKLDVFFRNKKYGDDINSIVIIFIIIKEIKGYEEWHKARKPKYIDYKLIENEFIGNIEIFKQFNIEYRFNNDIYEKFLNLSEIESEGILANEIINSLANLDFLPKKIKNFDRKKFENDINNYFKDEKLIT